MSEWRKDQAISMDRFKRLVTPRLLKLLGGEVKIIEGRKNDPGADMLDMFGGIDVWHKCPDGLFGIGSRVQGCEKSYSTFTVRWRRRGGNETEYKKRLRSIRSGSLYPRYMVHAYVDPKDESLLAWGLCETDSVFELIERGDYEERINKQETPWVDFLAIKWRDIRAAGFWIHTELPILGAPVARFGTVVTAAPEPTKELSLFDDWAAEEDAMILRRKGGRT